MVYKDYFTPPEDYLEHHGILGMKWGVRRTQAQLARAEKRDTKWAQTKGEKIKAKTQNAVKKDMNKFVRNELNATFKTNGKLSSESILRYNNKLAELMNQKVGDIPSPSGKVLRFVSKRGELGVHTALADAGYDMSQLDRGVFGSGKVAYKKDNLMQHSDIYHHGVLGMKWGIRKDNFSSIKTKNGDSISVREVPDGKIAKILQQTFPGIKRESEKSINAKIFDSAGKQVGDASLYLESPTSMNVVWIGVDKSAGGKGYAQAVMQASIQLAKDKGLSQVTLEVPGNSPNARHIYEKLGFKETSVVTTPKEDPYWGGLTGMTLDLTSVKHSQIVSTMDIQTWLKYIQQNIDNLMKGG